MAGNIWRILAIGLVLVLLGTGCGGGQETPSKPIKIGVLLPLTGPDPVFAIFLKTGIEAAFEEQNYVVAGREVQLVIEDAAADPSIGLDKARKLVEGDKVEVVIGPLYSHTAEGVIPYLDEQQLPNLSMMNHNIGLGQYEYFHGVGGVLKDIAYLMGQYAYDELGYRTVTSLGIDYVAGWDFVNGFADGFEERGGERIQEQWHPFEVFDFAPYLTNLEQADAFAVWSVAPYSWSLVKQAEDFGVDLPMVAPLASGMISEEHLHEVADAGLGIIGTAWYAPAIDTPENKEWVARIEAKMGEPLYGDGVYVAYRSASVLIDALERTEGDTDPETLGTAIQATELDTLTGKFRFDPDTNWGRSTFYVVQVEKVGGEYRWIPIAEYPDSYFGRE